MGLDDATLNHLAQAGALLRQRIPLSDEQKTWLETTQRDYPQFFAVPATSSVAHAAARANPLIPVDHHAIPLKDAYAEELMGKIAAGQPLTDNENGWYAVASSQLDSIRNSATASTTSGPAVSQLSLPEDQGALTPKRRGLVQTDLEREWIKARDEVSISTTPPTRYPLTAALQQQQQQHQQQQQQQQQPISNRPLHEPDSSPAAARKNRRAFTRPAAAQQHTTPSHSQPPALTPVSMRPPHASTPAVGPTQVPIPPPPPPFTTPAVGPMPHGAPLAGLSSGSSSAELIREYEEYSREHAKLRPQVLRYAQLEGLLRELEFKLYSAIGKDDGGV
ncbi:hypothetical protein GQ607_016942 [Colletotrichum asianum]|uniref:Uncharacterized protein n=1 Tax=Colletotrichum asianum TaxID=702518 RepID=A0A8H3VYH4_9PEZI|nr:hypothetical protein GQ607_016942 [Colletotrichum asianum]